MSIATKFTPLGGGNTAQNSEPLMTKETPGTYTLTLENNGYYLVELVGGGGGGAQSRLGVNEIIYLNKHGGGSGAAFVGEVYLLQGDYVVVVGKKGTNDEKITMEASNGGMGGYSIFNNNGIFPNNFRLSILARGGKGGKANAGYIDGGSDGAGGILDVDINSSYNTILASDGNSATGNGLGGASVYNGYGKGRTVGGKSTAGFFRITYLRAI